MIKYENSTLKIYIRNISKFIPISIQTKKLMLIYEITILNIALINLIMIVNI
jgi:hypothetical protein